MRRARGRALLHAAAWLGATAALAVAVRQGPIAEARSLPPGDTSLSAVASGLAGKPLTVRCWPASSWTQAVKRAVAPSAGIPARSVLGFAAVGGSSVDLAPAICARLRALASGAAPPDRLFSAAALVTLAHEAWHTRGIESEAVAECLAVQTARDVARRFAVAAAYAREAVHLYWGRYDEERPAYRTSRCRDGGPLDLRPASSLWP
jgi:hypothetical protein